MRPAHPTSFEGVATASPHPRPRHYLTAGLTAPKHQEWEFVPKGITCEYLVFVEENYKAKSLSYRWKP